MADTPATPASVSPETVALFERLEAVMEKMAGTTERTAEATKLLIESLAEGGDVSDEQREKLDKLREGYEKLGLSQGEIDKKMKAANAAMEDQVSVGEQLAHGMGRMIGLRKKMGASIANGITSLILNTKEQEKFVKALKDTFHPANLLLSVTAKMVESTAFLALETDKSLVSFNKATGAHNLYANEITSLEKDMMKYGVTIGDVTETYTSLGMSVMSFNKMSPITREGVVETTAMLNELGINTDTTANNIEFLTAVLGESGKQAAKTQRDLFVLAQAVGMPPQQMADDFKNAMPKLAAFGKQSTEVFKKMAINARAAGMSVEQMMNITEKFDKFDTAAEAVGRLNAALGGPYLSTLEMVTTTDPTERMKLMSNAIRETGKSFDSMEYYERKMIASSMGLSDVSELALVMKGKFNLLEGAVKKTSSEIEALAQQTADYNTVADVWATMMRQFAISLGPVLSGVKQLIMGLTRLANIAPAVKAFAGVVVAAIGAVVIALGVLSIATDFATMGITLGIKLIVAGIATITAGLALLYTYIGNLGDIFDSTNMMASTLKISIAALVIVFGTLMSIVSPLFAVIAIGAALIYAIIQVFVYWNDIVALVTSAIKPLMSRIGELQEKFAALGIIGGGTGDTMKVIGEWALWLAEVAIYVLVDTLLTWMEILFPIVELLDALILKSGLWKPILLALGSAILVVIAPFLLLAAALISLMGIFYGLLKVFKYVTSSVLEYIRFSQNLASASKWLSDGIEQLEKTLGGWWTTVKKIGKKFMKSPLMVALKQMGTYIYHDVASPSLLEGLDDLAASFGILGKAFVAPLRPLVMLLDKLKEFAKFVFNKSLFGKALGMISSIGGFFGFGTAEAPATGALTGTTNVSGAKTGGVKRESHTELAKAVGEEVAKQMVAAWKEVHPLVGKVEFDAVINPNPFFTFVSRGLDLQEAGKPPNHTKNLIMAGGKK